MNRFARVFRGDCHCGNLEIRLETDKAAANLATRNCGCGFCTRHGARTVTDPDGLAVITFHVPQKTHFYRFGLHTADFLICRECGVYAGAVIEHDGSRFATLNVNLLRERNVFPPPVPVMYDREAAAERRDRRVSRWTPARLIAG